MSCVFCDIINKKSKADIVLESDDFLAFTPLEQVSKGHILLIPKVHVESLLDIDDGALSELMVLGKKLASDLKNEHQATGINILHASGKDAGQSVLHFHIHIVPRYPNDGLDLWLKNNL